MVRFRMGQYVDRIRLELRASFGEDHSPRQVAGSFSLGTFITMMPTLGTGLILFVVIAYLFDSVSKLDLAASVVVFNPVVKWGVYVASLALGVFLLGTVDGVAMAEVSPVAGRALAVRLLVGNLILAIIAAVFSYVIAYRLTVRYRTTEIGIILDDAVEEIIDVVGER